MNMLRLVRFIIMLVFVTFPFLVGNDSPLNSVPTASAWCLGKDCDDNSRVPYCNVGDNCSLDSGTAIVKENISNIRTDVRFSDYVQGVIAYILGFLTLIVVILILWAGFSILTAAGDEEKVKNAKKIIVTAAIGLLIIFLAWSITTFLLGSSDGKNKGLINAQSGMLEPFDDLFSLNTAHAASNDSRGFDYYRSRIEVIAQAMSRDFEVDGKIKAINSQNLQNTIKESMDTFPETSRIFNTDLANNVLNQIALVQKYPDSDVYVERLAVSLKDYLTKVRVGTITAKITATPSVGNAPLTTTLRAVEAVDPSGVTIPDSNYVWWIRGAGNSRTILGKGPSIGYKFSSEAVYTVNLEITSASRNSKGKVDVMPFNGTQEVKVLPKLANILLFINGANASNVDTFKITPNQGRAGLVIDASSSTPAAGATIMRTEWDFGNGNLVSYNGAPRLERQVYAQEGIYSIKLKITTNENPVGIVKELRLVSQDPIASIRADKTVGFAGDDFKFNATSNLSNALLSYEWSVLESDGGKTLFTSKNQSFNYKFPRMGDFVVRLKTTSAGGKEDTDNLRIQIDSKNPIANFEAKPINAETPNTIILDATKSFDPDSLDSSKLQFNWTIDGERVDLDNPSRGGAIGQYTFSTKGNHTILLDLTNEQGKTTQAKKDIQIDSLLSVKLVTTPKISQLGNSVAFVAESKEATVFEWDFGDGEKVNTNEPRVFHQYKKSGTYDVRLLVRGSADAGASNSILRRVYITDADSPFASIGVKQGSDLIQPIPNACPAGEAFVTNRIEAITITGAESVNTDGSNNDLEFIWKYQGKTSTQKEFSYKFDELGCFPISLTVRSKKTGKTHSTSVLVKSENTLPTFASLGVSVDKPGSDPVVVNVSLNNASDPDGVIVSYLWYYYTDSDPEPQDFRITKTPKTAFVVPRINGKYFFAVTMEDSNGAKVNSEEAREERYSVTLASDNINTPLIQLKVSSSQVQVDNEVTFQATVKNVIGQDLTEKSEFKWDFDGDGFFDQTTTTPLVKHAYAMPGTYNMKVRAAYRGISNTKYQLITVKNEIIPNLEYFAIGNDYVFLNTTTGVFSKVKWTIGDATSENRDSFVVTVPEDLEDRKVTLEVGDGNSTKITTVPLRKDMINENRLKNSKDSVNVFSYPEIEGDAITVENKTTGVFLYLGANEGVTKYSIDADIKEDSNLNGDASDDADNKGTDSFTTGAPFLIKNFDSKKERTVRVSIFDGAGKKLGSRDIKIILSYVDEKVSAENIETKLPNSITDAEKVGLETLKDLIRTKVPEGQRVTFMKLLTQVQENWSDDREKTKAIIDFQLAVSELSISEDQKNEFLTILDSFLLTDSETKDDVALATSVLKKLIPTSNAKYEEIFGKDGKGGLIAEILSHPTNLDLNRGIGEKILSYIKDDSEISDADKLILKEQLRVIIYGGSKNIPADQISKTPSTDSENSGILDIIKNIAIVFAWFVGIVFGCLLLLFLVFKLTNKNESLGFQDFIIEKIFGKAKPSTLPVKNEAPVVPSASASSSAPSASTDILGAMSQEQASNSQETQRPVLTPITTPVSSIAATETIPESQVARQIPSWLKDTTDRLTSTPETLPSQADSERAFSETSSSSETSQSTSEAPVSTSADLPSWLIGSSVEEDSLSSTQKESGEAPLEILEDSTEILPIVEELPSESNTILSGGESAAENIWATESAGESAWTGEYPGKSDFPNLDTSVEPEALTIASEPMITQGSEPASTPEIASAPEIASTPEAVPTPVNDDLPDWLKSFAPTPSVDSSAKSNSNTEEDVFGDAEIVKTFGTPESTTPGAPVVEEKPKAPKTPKPKKQKASTPMPEIQPTANTDDLPDWLK